MKHLFIILLFCSVNTVTVLAQMQEIRNDVFWYTKDGKPINSQGGGIFRFADPKTGIEKYYWYGVYYEEADGYRNNPVRIYPKCTFKAVTCYSSADLVNWTHEADVLTKDAVIAPGQKSWVGRLGVAYIREMGKYALFVQHDKGVLIALSDSPAGLFTWHRKINMQQMIGTPNTGDQTVFTDDATGKSYLVYSYGNGRNKIYVSEIGVKDGVVDLLDCTKVFQGESREGNCMFKYKGKYYMVASNIYGWDASFAYYLVADDIRGPYLPENNMLVLPGCEKDYAHVTQTGFFVNVKGSKQETVVYCGDRWANFAGNGLGYNQWFPLSFNHDIPYFNSLSSWSLNEKTGEWKVNDDNNYVMNGSFEADRRRIPSHVKPVQEYLLGWTTVVHEGNAVSLDSNSSPVLNYFNTEADRTFVTGEKSLQITDRLPFSRTISQTILSSPYVKLQDGYYDLTASVRNSEGFSQLEMYAASNGKMFSQTFKEANSSWKKISVKAVLVKGGNIEIGFRAAAAANAFCYIDDITLVKAK